jgi:hypothetical protein
MRGTRILSLSILATSALLCGRVDALDCIIASRSAQGDASAGSHAAVWAASSVSDFAHSPEFPPGFDPDCFVAAWLAGGGPVSFTVRTNKVIGSGSSNPNLADGRGLDHIEDAYGALFGASLAACAL